MPEPLKESRSENSLSLRAQVDLGLSSRCRHDEAQGPISRSFDLCFSAEMETVTNPDQANALKACRMCGEDVLAVARLCKHCGTHLAGWNKYISLSSSVLAMCVALVSVLTWAVPQIDNAMKPDASDVQVVISRASRDQIYLAASNYGKRSGSVAGGAIISVGTKMLERPIILEGDQSLRFMPANTAREVAFRIPQASQPILAREVSRIAGRSDAFPRGSTVTRSSPGSAPVGLSVRLAQSGSLQTEFREGLLVTCRHQCVWGISDAP